MKHLLQCSSSVSPAPPLPNSPISATQFTDLPTRSKSYAVALARNPLLLPLKFGPDFQENRMAYLENPRLSAKSCGPYSFHPPSGFLDHPFD
jgi:hypothetical protein